MESFCAPIWWEIDHKTILGNGSMCVIETPQSVFGVTANHVLTIYEGHKVAHPDAFCQLGSAPFDPIANLIARSERWDLATFGIPDFTLKHWGRHHRIYKTEAWPPPTIKNNDQIILGGYPTNRRTQVLATIVYRQPHGGQMTEDELQELVETVAEAHAGLSEVAFKLRRELTPKGPAPVSSLNVKTPSLVKNLVTA